MTEPAQTPLGSKRFWSLKWKVVLLLSLVLVMINGTFTYLGYRTLRSQFDDTRRVTLERHVQLLGGLLGQSADRLKQVGGLIATTDLVARALDAGDPDQIKRQFDPIWSKIQLQTGLEQAEFYDRSGVLLATWGSGDESVAARTIRKALVEEAASQEVPVDYLECLAGCVQEAAVPVLVGGKYVGSILVGSSFADLVVSYKHFTGADIGVLLPAGATRAAASDREIPQWNARILALSGEHSNLQVLQAVRGEGRAFGNFATVYDVPLNGRKYEVMRVQMQAVSRQAGAGLFVLVSDITDAVQQIREATWRGLVAGIIGLLISETLVLLLLWAPMARLTRTARTIPLLGQGAFEAVRGEISRYLGHGRLRDEIDVLDESSIALAGRLETLQLELSQRADALTELVDELSREKDFVTGLLDTAQAIILTQNLQGKLVMTNRYGESLAGKTQDELVGAEFVRIFCNPELAENSRDELRRLATGEQRSLRRESVFTGTDGTPRNILWVHSRLPGASDEGPAILSVGIDVTEQRQAEERLSFLADYDALTGLYNRRRFQDEVRAVIAHVSHEGGSGVMISFDIDEFKYVNDAGGHQAGDMVLRAVAQELQRLSPQPDVTSRLGGDDFAMVFARMDAAEAIQMARQINQRLASIELPGTWRSHKISACSGIVLFPAHGRTPQELLSHADLAMFHAKEKGRGGWHLFSPDEQLMERVLKRVYWVEKIEQALAEDRFELNYQPILKIRGHSVSHYECLVRMRKQDGTLATPGEFIRVAETTGLIRAIDHMVLRKALAKLAELEQSGSDARLSINLSARSFEDPVIVEILKQELERRGVNPANLIFEITETAAVEDFQAARQLMESVRELGCAFALDDFGVGFSSFHYLKQLPVDYIKIDGSFIRNLVQSEDDRVFVKVIVEAAQGFGKKTVAEFVENAEILELLRQFGVDYAQGYHIGRPSAVIPLEAA